MVWTMLGNMGARDFDPYIVYDLGAVRNINGIRIWNYNSAAVTTMKTENAEASTMERPFSVVGVKEMEILTSADGKSYTPRGTFHLEMASGDSGDKRQKIDIRYEGVRFVKFDIHSTHEGTVFDGTGEKLGDYDQRGITGLSKVRFIVPGEVEVIPPAAGSVLEEGGDGSACGSCTCSDTIHRWRWLDKRRCGEFGHRPVFGPRFGAIWSGSG